jgi:hypothetical protein
MARLRLFGLGAEFAFQFFEIAFVGFFSFLFFQGIHFGVVECLQRAAVEVAFRRACGELVGVCFGWLRNELVGSLCLRPGIRLLYVGRTGSLRPGISLFGSFSFLLKCLEGFQGGLESALIGWFAVSSTRLQFAVREANLV